MGNILLGVLLFPTRTRDRKTPTPPTSSSSYGVAYGKVTLGLKVKPISSELFYEKGKFKGKSCFVEGYLKIKGIVNIR